MVSSKAQLSSSQPMAGSSGGCGTLQMSSTKEMLCQRPYLPRSFHRSLVPNSV